MATFFLPFISYLLSLQNNLSLFHFVDTEWFSIEQRILVVKTTHYKNSECFAENVHKLRANFERDDAATATLALKLV